MNDLKAKNDRWAINILRYDIKVDDPDKFLKEIRDYWKMVYKGKDIPKKIIPKFHGQRPKDSVYTHQDTQELIKSLTERLRLVVEILDGITSKQKAHPYR